MGVDRYKAVAWTWQEGRFVRATELQPLNGVLGLRYRASGD